MAAGPGVVGSLEGRFGGAEDGSEALLGGAGEPGAGKLQLESRLFVGILVGAQACFFGLFARHLRFPREEEMVCVELESTNRGASDGHLSTYYLVTVPQPFPLAPAPGLNAQGRRYMDEVYDTAWVPVANAPELLRRTDASALHHALATLDATHPHTTIPVGYEPEPPRPLPAGWPRLLLMTSTARIRVVGNNRAP